MALGRQVGLANEGAAQLLAEVLKVVAEWRLFFANHGVPEQDCERLAPDIEMRLQNLKK